jgi:hypothetical protein
MAGTGVRVTTRVQARKSARPELNPSHSAARIVIYLLLTEVWIWRDGTRRTWPSTCCPGEGTPTLSMKTSLMLQFANGPWGRPLGELLPTCAAYAGVEQSTIGPFRIRPVKMSQIECRLMRALTSQWGFVNQEGLMMRNEAESHGRLAR